MRVPHPNVSDKYIYSYAAKGGTTANIHPLTDPIMRAWFRAQGQNIDDAFSGYGSSSAVPIPTETEINIIKAVVKEVIKDLLRAVKDDFGTGITVDNFDPITTPFNADSKGFDKVLDGTKINMSGGTVSIAVTPDSTLETDVRTTGGNTTATVDTTNISLTADTTPPTAPTNLSALSVSSSQILLTWSASSSTDVLGYKVYQDGTEVATVTSTVYIVPGLSASTSYTFTVKAFDGATNLSDASTPASATTSAAATDTTKPTAPTGLTATVVSSTQIDLSWTASTDAVGVAGYIVYRDGTAAAKVFTTNFSDIGLTANTSYAYTVIAFDGAGNKSAASSSATGSTSTTTTDTIAPTAPTNLTATAVSRSEINLSWTASTDAVGVSGYYVYRGTTKIGTVTSTTYSDTGLSASTEYCYTVKAYDAANNVSSASTGACATTEAKPTNPLVGTWGVASLRHSNTGAWATESTKVTFNSDGICSGSGTWNMNGSITSSSYTCTYTTTSNTDGSITLSMTLTSSGSSGSWSAKVVLSDDGNMIIIDGTSDTSSQFMHVWVRLDTTKTYSNADLIGDYYGIGYNIYSGGIYAASQIITFDGNGNYSLSETGNENGTIGNYTESGTYSVSTDGSTTFTSGPAGYLSGDGKLGISASVNDATKFSAGVSMKKADKTYSTSDLAGTWAFVSFGDYQGTNFRAEIGTWTCDSSGSCTYSMKTQRSDGSISYYSGTDYTMSVASDGSIGSYGAIGNNGNTMIFAGNFDGTNPNDRSITVAIKCSTCSDLVAP